MNWLRFIEVFLLIHLSIQCSSPSFQNLTVQADFSLQKFLGRWYEIKWLSAEYHNDSDKWQDYSQDFQMNTSDNRRLLVNGQARLFNQQQCFTFGPWSIIANDSAKMILETKNRTSTTLLNWPYWILSTDYIHSALVYSCMSMNYSMTEPCDKPIVWIFSRTKSLSSNDSTFFDSYIQNTLCINSTTLEMTPQTNISCDPLSSSALKMLSMNITRLFILLLLYVFLIYK